MAISRILCLYLVSLVASDDTSLVQLSVQKNTGEPIEADVEAERQVVILATETAQRASALARTAADSLSKDAHTEPELMAAARADQVAIDIRRAAESAAFEVDKAKFGDKNALAKARTASNLATSLAESAGLKVVHSVLKSVGAATRASKSEAQVEASSKVEAAAAAGSAMEVQLTAEHLMVPKDMAQDGIYSHLLQAKRKFDQLGDKCHEKASSVECDAGRHMIDALLGMTLEESKRITAGTDVTPPGRVTIQKELEKNFKKVMAKSVMELAESREGSAVTSLSREKALIYSATFSVALNHWLYNPGPFEILDLDRNKSITYTEATSAIRSMTGGEWPGGRYMFSAMDTDRDGLLSRHDVHSFLRGALYVREYVPELDLVRPDANLTQLLFLANQNTDKVVRPKLRTPVKFVVVFSIPIIAYIVHSFACAKKKPGVEEKPVL